MTHPTSQGQGNLPQGTNGMAPNSQAPTFQSPPQQRYPTQQVAVTMQGTSTPIHYHQTPQQQQQQGNVQYQQQQQMMYPQQQPSNPQMQQHVLEGTPQAAVISEEAPSAATPVTPAGLKGTLENLSARFTSPHPQENVPNVGFTPTPAMVKRHERTARSEPPRPLYKFQVTKLRTWRTGYVRLLCLYKDEFCTIDPESHEVTNTWSYDSLTDWLAIPKENECILLQVVNDKLKLKCHLVERSIVLTALLECKFNSSLESQDYPLFQACQRQTRHGTRISASLKVAPHGLLELNPTTKGILQTYRYSDILAVSFLSDETSGIVLHFSSYKSRVFFVESSRRGGNGRSDLLTGMREQCDSLGLELRIKESSTLPAWMERRRALGRNAGPIVTTWDVTKTTRRHDAALVGHEQGWMRGTVNRRLAVTGKGLLLEMDAGGVVSCRKLADLHALVRHPHADTLTLEYKNGTSRMYASANRDALLVSLLDAANYLGNNASVTVSDVTSGGYCLSSMDASFDEQPSSSTGIIFQTISIPVHCLKRLHSVSTAAFAFLSRGTESSTREGEKLKVGDECKIVIEACREFNASVPPTGAGLPDGASDKYILGSVGALWGILSMLLQRPSDSSNIHDWHEAELAATPMFQALYRLSQTPAGYKGTAELDTMQDCLALLWQLDDSFCQFWMLRVIRSLLSGAAKRDKEVEFVNKSVILRTGGTTMIDGLVSTMLEAGSTHPGGQRVVSDLVLFVASDILQSVLCSGFDTTSPEHFSAFIKALAMGHRALLTALRSPTPFVIENTALLLHLLSTHDPVTSAAIREAALGSGLLLQHFHSAIFSPLEGQRFLSRYLCSLWLSGPMDCDEKRLLKRMVPRGFINYLKMPLLSRMEEEQLDELERDAVFEARRATHSSGDNDNDAVGASGAAGTNTSRLRARVALAVESAGTDQKSAPENFRIFFHVLTKDHALADLIWNQQTRQELRMALENEIQSIRRATESRGGVDHIAWNHQQFTVEYPSLDNEVKVGTVYMRLWLQAGDGFIKSWEEPYRLFELLFRRFLCELDRNSAVTIMCIRCLERLYAIHADKIGPFSDIMILVRSMASTKSTETQHRLLGLVATLLGVSGDEDRHGKISIPENAEQLLNVESIGQLCQFVAWGHTNGEQVGNLLSKMLQASEQQRQMITDGSRSGPGGEPGIEGTSASVPKEASGKINDGVCPPVWFVSSTGRTPPPPDTIKGPFRVSKLMAMMESGEISPYDQITASHVEDYAEDEEEPESTEQRSSSVKDAHIDTGKWRRINQVWQLRWQLCSDGSSSGIYGPSEVSLIALKALTRLVDLHRSLDSRGVPYFPVPFAKRLLCGLSREIASASTEMDQADAFLPILSQSLLCNDHRAVATSAELLHKLMLHNEDAVSKFYLTGAFFFGLNYTGNNFLPISELLYATHLKQHFRSGFAAAADDSELPLKDRSILGNMIPEGLLFVLVNYGVERFTEIFVGNYDTPEVIWNLEMRKHLVEMIRQHLGDFPKRLWQNTTARYEYCPIPGIAYQRLEKEIFCHNYYLNNLCDEARFPEWPIAEPVEVFRACLEEWKLQLRRDAHKEEDAQEEARIVLSLKSGDGSKELRKSYRSLARKYHPDKNPAGRDMFEAIQEAYELLLPVVEGGGMIIARSSDDEKTGSCDDAVGVAFDGISGGKAQMQTMHLLIKTQLLICRRYAHDMSKYKYPAYSMLFGCIEVPTSCRDLILDSETISSASLLMKERAEFIQTASDLVFHTCLVSPLNAEELIAEGGIPILDSLLNFYVEASSCICDKSFISNLPEKAPELLASEDTIMAVLSNLIHTIAGVAYFESGRKAILSLNDPERLAVNFRRCIDCTFKGVPSSVDGTSSMKRFALEGVANLAKSSELQELLIGSGIVWPLLRYMLAYDPTLEGEFDHDDDNADVSQSTNNELGRLAARALGALAGVMTDAALMTPANEELQKALKRLLTDSIAQMLRNKRTGEILRTLNANVETPVRIWNIAMRRELSEFVARMEDGRQEDSYRSPRDELADSETFEYTSLKSEVAVGGVYLRVFNSLGGGHESFREIADSSQFAAQLLSFIALCMNQSEEMGVAWTKLSTSAAAPEVIEGNAATLTISSPQFLMAVKAFSLLVRVDGLVDDVVSDGALQSTSILLSLLELPQHSKAFSMGCDILSILSPKQSFADAVVEQDSLWRLLWVLERPEENETDSSPESSSMSNRLQRGWSLLESLSSSSSVAMQLVHSSGWLELLGIIAGYDSFTKLFVSRLGAAKTLSMLLWDETTGPRIGSLLQRFLPSSLQVVLKEKGPENMLKLFDKDSETPEVIWNGDMRSEIRDALAEQLDPLVKVRTGANREKEEFRLSPNAGAKYKALADELYIGGVYVRLFLKEPTFNLRDPTGFLEKLMIRWTHELELYTSSAKTSGESDPVASSGEVTEAQQDVLQLVTSASVYLCKVHDSLCDKLAQWGYMTKGLSLLQDVLDCELLGAPLLSIMRIFHVASNRQVNVEALALAGGADGTSGIVFYTMNAIGKDPLHADSAFMLEVLLKIYRTALGDVKKGSKGKIAVSRNDPVSAPEQSGVNHHIGSYAMAPSPAPGLDPIRRSGPKTKIDHPLDHPLAAFGGDQDAPSSNRAAPPPRDARARTAGPRGQPVQQTRYGQTSSLNGHPLASSLGPASQPIQQHGNYGLQSNQNPVPHSNQSYQYGNGATQGISSTASAAPVHHQSSIPAVSPAQSNPMTHHVPLTMSPQPQPYAPQTNAVHSTAMASSSMQTQPVTATGTQFQAASRPSQQSYQNTNAQVPFPSQDQGSTNTSSNTGQMNPTGLSQLPQNFTYSQQPISNVGTQYPVQQRQPQAMFSPGYQQKSSQESHPVVPMQQPVGGIQQQMHPYATMMEGQQMSYPTQMQGVTSHVQASAPTPQQQTIAHTAAPVQQQQSQGSLGGQPMAQQGANPMFPSSHHQQQGTVQEAPILNQPMPRQQQPPAMAPATTQISQPVATQSQNSDGVQYAQQVSASQQQPIVETVSSSPTPTSQPRPYRPTPVEGIGIDARSAETPKQKAEQQILSFAGAPGSAQGRVALLQSALQCELPRFVVDDVLENPLLANVKDPAAAKVHAIELLKLLTMDPGYGLKFKLILDELPAWKKYKSQDHSLFITGAEQKTDYFLTDGDKETTKLLTER